MPVQRRHRGNTTPPPSPHEGEKADESDQGGEDSNEEQLDDSDDSDGSSESTDGEEEEFITVNLADLRKEFQCPICLGIIRKTRTVMECLHRFCRECIDKAMRLGNNECPACRTHCASRRSLRDDPNFDTLIAALFPNIDKYEEEELAFHAEEKTLNDQIQASIAQTFQRQAEAVGKKRTTARAASAAVGRRQSKTRNSRRGKKHRVVEYDGSDEEEGADEHSSGDERSAEVKPRRYKRRSSAQTSQTSPAAKADGNDPEGNGELSGASSTLTGNGQSLTWGRGGLRSNNRHGGRTWGGGRLARSDRVPKLANWLQRSHEKYEVQMNVVLVPLNGQKISSLNRPYISCGSTLTVRQLCEFVAMQTSENPNEIEMLIIKDVHPANHKAIFDDESCVLNPCPSKLQVLDDDQTLEEIHAKFMQPNLVFGYRTKIPSIFWL